jgi:hypothetical protein
MRSSRAVSACDDRSIGSCGHIGALGPPEVRECGLDDCWALELIGAVSSGAHRPATQMVRRGMRVSAIERIA